MFDNIKEKLLQNAEKLESALSDHYGYTDSDYPSYSPHSI